MTVVSTRDALLDAVHAELEGRAWADVSLAAVAARAGVSRQTVYNAFGSREELAQAYVLREADRFLADFERAVRSHADDPTAALQAAFDVFLGAAADDAFVRAVVAGDEALLPLVTTQGGPLVERATARLAGVLAELFVDEADAADLAEVVVRLAISVAVLPGLDGHAVARLLGPALRR